MMNLNSDEFRTETLKIFNNGVAGKVKNVIVSVEDKEIGQPDTYPDYKIIYTDKDGSFINDGFYINNTKDTDSDELKEKKINTNITRILQVLRSLVGENFHVPDLGNVKEEVIPGLFDLLRQNAGGKSLNLFVTFGTKTYPNKKGYLGVRYYGTFAEHLSVADDRSQLFAKPNDLMERIVPANIKEEDTNAKNFFDIV